MASPLLDSESFVHLFYDRTIVEQDTFDVSRRVQPFAILSIGKRLVIFEKSRFAIL